MTPDLHTTNLLLGIMAGVSVFEALVIIVLGIAGISAYRRAMTAVDRGMVLAQALDVRHAATLERVNAILDDVKGVTATVKEETERVDQAIHSTMHRIDDTAERMRTSVRVKTSTVVGILRGARVALEAFLHSEPGTVSPRTWNSGTLETLKPYTDGE